MPAHLEFFSEDRLALHKEITYHPSLQRQLIGAQDFSDKLGTAAAYVNIALDDLYTDEDIDSICAMIVWRLRDKRKLLVLPG